MERRRCQPGDLPGRDASLCRAPARRSVTPTVARPCDHRAVAELPIGWSIDRIKSLGVKDVVIRDPREHYVVTIVYDDLEEMEPAVIIDCGGLCLVRPQNEPEWYMGQLDADGSIVCWASYGSDLENAILAL
jgi:hypothetical protein